MEIDLTLAKHFSFDLWLTLIFSNPDFKPKRNQLFKDYFEIDKSIEEVGRVLRHFDILANQISEITGKHFDGNQIYCLALKSLGINLEKITNRAIELFRKEVDQLFLLHKPLLINPKINEVFQEIKDLNKTISLLSNTAFISGEILRDVLNSYGLSKYFEFQIYSDEIGFSKPNKRIFEYLFNEVKNLSPITKGEIIHIGDNENADYYGALNYGFKALLV